MQKLVYIVFSIVHILKLRLSKSCSTTIGKILLYGNGASYGEGLSFIGVPRVRKSPNGVLRIGNNIYVRSYYSDTGEWQPTTFRVKGSGELIVGDNVGITSSLIFCNSRILIGNNVKIGGGCRIFDTNFHSTDYRKRSTKYDVEDVRTAPVYIGDDVFIGTGCIITKGVTIGNRSIIAAGSVVVKNVPEDEIWGGDPAVFLKKI